MDVAVQSLSFRALALVLCALTQLASATEPISFNRDIRGILSAKCYHCHGPDEQHREADLRFDQGRTELTEAGVLVPGDPEESELIRRIRSSDPDEQMPPPAAKLELTPREQELLTRWIQEGAAFEGHWAFLPPRSPDVPAAREFEVPRRNEVDAFVQARLASQGLHPAPEADRRTLIRRATLDLWGLPPTPAEIQAFLRDTRPHAYERLIDRLLDSPRYGERMTVAWMDAARYGDTSVFHADGPRDMWPWRDWVLQAYNHNLPFDQFTRDQLAGDLVPSPTQSQLVATGFNRNHGTTDEGGAIDEEYRVEYMVDRVKTTSMVWLGLTMECAQCHDHKYDPITQDDYYRFFAFFNQTPERGMQTRNGNAEPRIMVPNPAQSGRLAELEDARKRLESAFDETTVPQTAFTAWLAAKREKTTQPTWGTWHRIGPFPADSPKTAFRKNFGPEKKVDLEKTIGSQKWHAEAWTDGQVINFAYEDANAVTYVYRTIEVSEPTVLPISLGSDDSVKVWLNGKSILQREVNRAAAADQEQLSLQLTAGTNRLLLKICNNTGPTGFYFRAGDLSLPEELEKILALPETEWQDEQQKKLQQHFKSKVWPEGIAQVEAIAAAKKQHEDFRKSLPTVMVMKDMDEPRMTYVLDRGNYASPNKERAVSAGTPQFLPTLASAPASRLGLANWLTDDDHPLTARVTVNRYWTMLFGQGIVATVADFGSQGAWPSHPALLDYLARDFVDSGWNVKRMLRKIMTSHTYRQSSDVTPAHLQHDPRNVYLARAPRLRLSAEFIRDNALSLAGLLVEQLGGPGVKPYQPPGLWNEVSLSGNVRFVQDHGAKLYRRTMYTYWKRSSPQPAMMAFDVPTREKCVIQRQRTNTPLQALVTLNDPQFVEAARCFAERLLETKCANDSERINHAFEMATGRPATEMRRELLLELLRLERQRYQQHADDARALLKVGEAARNPALEPAEHAAWTIIASTILNLDETLNKE